MSRLVKRVWFFNHETDDFGMPSDYRAYVVIGSDESTVGVQSGHGIAKAYTLSQSALALKSDYVVGQSAADAVENAVKCLKDINYGLQVREEAQGAP